MVGLTAVLIDTVSNQEYIYSGNRLKENLGGSHLLKTAYEKPLKEALEKVTHRKIDIDAWVGHGDQITLTDGAAVGFIGGGNALVFFDIPGRAMSFTHEFSRSLLISRPGLKTAFAMLSSFDAEQFQIAMQSLHDELQTAKNCSFPRTIPPRHGITAACPYSGEAIEVDREDKTRKQAVSALSHARLAAAKISRKALTAQVQSQLQNLRFTYEIGELGQGVDKSYVAVVHADGNDMGRHFMKCKSLGELRKRSATVSIATQKAFSLLVEDAVRVVKEYLADDKGFRFGDNGHKKLPLLPIIIGGDDITFVCDGRLGLYFAERFLKHIEATSKETGFQFKACAGVAIVKTKYPFFKAYKYAEELCSAAKRESRDNHNTAYLDFLISSGGFSGSIEHIRDRHFTRAMSNEILNRGDLGYDGKELHYGPYRCNNRGHDKSTATLRDGIKHFLDRDKWSHARAMRLRELLRGNSMQCCNFVSANGLQLPGITGIDELAAKLKSNTPFYDMLDAMDFYPQVLLDEVER